MNLKKKPAEWTKPEWFVLHDNIHVNYFKIVHENYILFMNISYMRYKYTK